MYDDPPVDDQILVFTNNREREVKNYYDLPEKVRTDQFYYINAQKAAEGEEGTEFVKYRGNWYDLEDNEGRWTGPGNWDGYYSNSFFSGVVFRYPREEGYPGALISDYVIMGQYYVGQPKWALTGEFRRKSEAIDYLTADGNLAVPCSRYGKDSAECAQVAWRLAYLLCREIGEFPVKRDLLDDVMSLVVNDRDDVAYVIRTYGNRQYRTN